MRAVPEIGEHIDISVHLCQHVYMKQLQLIKATEARKRFFELLKMSYLNKSRFLIEKGGIPVVYLTPVLNVQKNLKRRKLSRTEFAKKLLEIKGEWFDYKEWKKVRKDTDKSLQKMGL